MSNIVSDTTLTAVILTVGIPFVLVLIRRTWSGADSADAAFIKGHQEAKTTAREDLRELRDEFRTAMAEQDARHSQATEVLEAHVGRLHRALAKLVELVAPEHMAEATSVLIELGLPVPSASESFHNHQEKPS